MPPVLYLIDGHALAYRTFFALTRGGEAGFVTRSGEPTAGVFGFTSVLLRLLEREKPEYLAVALDELLDTGGGLKNAAWLFDDGRPFFLHNVDVLSDIDLTAMLRFHTETRGLATLAVQHRTSSRQLLFDASARLVGRKAPQGVEWAQEPVVSAERLGFTGIHVIDPAIFPKMNETGVFPITRTYLRLASKGERIVAFRADGLYWQDIGSAETLERARRRARELLP